MWTSGLTGTHRTYISKDAATFVQEVRAKTIKSLEDGLRGNTVRIQRFVQKYNEAEVVASDDLQKQARAILNVRSQLEAGLAAAMNGDPLIFSVEIDADKGQVEGLRADKLVGHWRRKR